MCVCLLVVFVGCSTPTRTSIQSKLRSEDYIISSVSGLSLLGLYAGSQGVKHRITAIKYLNVSMDSDFNFSSEYYKVIVDWFWSESDAQTAYEKALANYGEDGAFIKGKMVAFGDAQAVAVVKS